MQCPKCGGHNETGARFCGDCGATLAIPRAVVTTAQPPARIYCQRCGAANPASSKYCEGCGAAVMPIGVSVPASVGGNTPVAKTGKSSGAWWLMPLLFGWLGGLIAWAAVIKNNPSKARWMLALGLLVTAAWIALAAALPDFPSLPGFNF